MWCERTCVGTCVDSAASDFVWFVALCSVRVSNSWLSWVQLLSWAQFFLRMWHLFTGLAVLQWYSLSCWLHEKHPPPPSFLEWRPTEKYLSLEVKVKLPTYLMWLVPSNISKSSTNQNCSQLTKFHNVDKTLLLWNALQLPDILSHSLLPSLHFNSSHISTWRPIQRFH